MERPSLPKKYKANEAMKKWREFWEQEKIYNWDPDAPKENTFVVDTPPPTVSGSLHMGHLFSYTQTDILVRQKRMLGMNIFYPMGWDDNGLPTERRVQTLHNIRCNPSVDYDENFNLGKKGKSVREVSRKNFLELCSTQTKEDEKKYEDLWRNLGLSIDWNQQYETINEHARKISQLSFLDLLKKGYVYQKTAPTMWDIDFQTAIAQAEVEDKEVSANYHDLLFSLKDGEENFVISTTRPELLPACIAVVAHPQDERYQHLFGKEAITPLFEVPVPIRPSTHADPEKGTGILMVCTFGDSHDVHYFKTNKLPLRQILDPSGRLVKMTFASSRANDYYQQLIGLNVKQAQKKIVELLEGASLLKDKRPTKHFVKYYEKGSRPLEYISTRQWFIKILEHKDELIAQGKKIKWHPPHMFNRYEQWVENLNQDWCISRQRFFGVPFPVWYSLDEYSNPRYDSPIIADPSLLPIDPQVAVPPGYDPQQRGKKNGFIGDPDVMDTWATSSCTPLINSYWGIDSKKHAKLFPANLRPQAHEIIRTWAFYTITKAWMHEKQIPWESVAISGWVINPDRKKMSKSKGNTVTPEGLLEEFSADALRYWAGRARLGQDTIYDENVFKLGKRLSTKLFNAAKFVFGFMENFEDDKGQNISLPLDRAWGKIVNETIVDASQLMDNFDYAGALASIESTFWDFCDNYLETVKTRAYQHPDKEKKLSALSTLSWTLQNFLKLFAPYMPFICEEIWSWVYANDKERQGKSVHKECWPTPLESLEKNNDLPENIMDLARQIVRSVRAKKTDMQKSLKWPVEKLKIEASREDLHSIELIIEDLKNTCNLLNDPEFVVSDEPLLKIDIYLNEQ